MGEGLEEIWPLTTQNWTIEGHAHGQLPCSQNLFPEPSQFIPRQSNWGKEQESPETLAILAAF